MNFQEMLLLAAVPPPRHQPPVRYLYLPLLCLWAAWTYALNWQPVAALNGRVDVESTGLDVETVGEKRRRRPQGLALHGCCPAAASPTHSRRRVTNILLAIPTCRRCVCREFEHAPETGNLLRH